MKLTLGCVIVTVGCSFSPGTRPGDAGIPADSSDAPRDAMTGWSTPVEIPGISSGSGDDDPSLTDDMLEIFWGSRRTPTFGGEDIWTATRASINDPWGEPVNVADLNSNFADTTMKVTGNGLAIYFASTRNGSADIFVSSRADRTSQWSMPTRILELSTAGGDYSPHATSNRLHVVLCSGANEPSEALFTAERADISEPWGTLVRIAELDETDTSECDPFEPHPRAIYYASDRSTDGTYDIYRAARSSAATPYGSREMVENVNLATFNDRDPWVSPDERTMVMSSDRDGGIDKIYMSTRAD